MQNFVGVMDSGVGGLTVLSQLVRVAPRCNYVYVADHAFCPYGTKTFAEIQTRAIAVAKFLQRQGPDAIVVACNTASVFATDIAMATNLPVYDVISPTCRAVTKITKNKRVALLATDATTKSQAYQNALTTYGIQVFAYSCSQFVPLVENCATAAEISGVIKSTLSDLPDKRCDTVILGCTHFPFLTDYIEKHVGNAQIVSCDRPVAQLFAQNVRSGGIAKQLFYTTGDPSVAHRAAKPFANVKFVHVDI